NMPGALRSTPAVVGRTVYLGDGWGVIALDAVTGAKVWRSQDVGPTVGQVLSSPGITGPAQDRVLFVGDAGGIVRAFDLCTGQPRWSFDTGGVVYSSPAISAGLMYVASASGFLYAFGFGGGVSAPPDTVLSAPVNGSTFTMPNGGPITVSGTASDDVGVQQVA